MAAFDAALLFIFIGSRVQIEGHVFQQQNSGLLVMFFCFFLVGLPANAERHHVERKGTDAQPSAWKTKTQQKQNTPKQPLLHDTIYCCLLALLKSMQTHTRGKINTAHIRKFLMSCRMSNKSEKKKKKCCHCHAFVEIINPSTNVL